MKKYLFLLIQLLICGLLCPTAFAENDPNLSVLKDREAQLKKEEEELLKNSVKPTIKIDPTATFTYTPKPTATYTATFTAVPTFIETPLPTSTFTIIPSTPIFTPTTAATPITVIKENGKDKILLAHQESKDLKICQENLTESVNQINVLTSQLNELRSKLMIAETQVERLSTLVDGKALKNSEKVVDQDRQPRVTNTPKIDIRKKELNDVSPLELPHTSTLPNVCGPTKQTRTPIVTVTVTLARLKEEPSRDATDIMSVAEGTKLAVESRKGSWLQVISPTGVRAWIESSSVVFGAPIDKKQASTLDNEKQDNADFLNPAVRDTAPNAEMEPFPG